MKKYSRIIALLLAVALVLPGAGLAAKAEEDANEVHRLYGANRYETAVEVSKEAYPTTAKNVILASGESSVDALTGTSLAGKLDAPILYTTKGELHAATKAQLKALGAETVYLLGGPGVISEAVKTELEGLSYKVERIYGKGRAETAVEVAKELGATHTRAYLVTDGLKTALADALAVAPVSYMQKRPVLLTGKTALTAATKAALEEFNVTHVTIIGGEGVISEEVATELKGLVSEVERISGKGRAETAVKIAETLFTPAPTKAVLANGWKNDLADALAGGYFGGKMVAPILYATKAGALEKATEEYLDTTFTHVYVLGGPGVVTKAAEKAALEAISPLEVKSVSAITDTVLDQTTGQALGFTVNEGREVTLAELTEAGYTVAFLADAEVLDDGAGLKKSTNADGKVHSAAAITDFKYQVVITPEEGDAIESNLQSVTVLTAADWASVESAQMIDDTVAVNTLVVGNATTLLPTKATLNDKKVLDKDNNPPTNWAAQVKSVKSSNVAVATVAVDGAKNVVSLTGISAGTAKITVTLKNDFEFTKTITVKEDARVAKIATTKDLALTDAQTAIDATEIVVADQYGDPFKSSKGVKLVSSVDANDSANFTFSLATLDTDLEGKVESTTITPKAGLKTGKYKVYVLKAADTDVKKAIGSFMVDYTVADEVVSYALEIHSGSESKDATIDRYDDEDNQLVLRFVGLDKNNNVAKIAKHSKAASTPALAGLGFAADDEFTVEFTGDTDAVTAAVKTETGSNSDVISLTANTAKTGTVKVVVKKASITVATYTVTVKDSTPVVTGLKLATDAKIDVTGAKFDLNNAAIKALVEVLGKDGLKLEHASGVMFNVLDGTEEIAELEVISSDESVFEVAKDASDAFVEVKKATGAEADDTADMILRLTQNGKIVKTVTIPVTIK